MIQAGFAGFYRRCRPMPCWIDSAEWYAEQVVSQEKAAEIAGFSRGAGVGLLHMHRRSCLSAPVGLTFQRHGYTRKHGTVMASGRLLRQLIKSGAEGNRDLFQRVSEEVIRDERAKNHHMLANDLERILYARAESEGVPPQLIERVPKDKERGLPLLHVCEPVRLLDDLILSDENRSLLDELLTEHHRSELLHSHGLYPSDRLLFCGPPPAAARP
jgi:hypothetical protein